jgi:hypothetical protein
MGNSFFWAKSLHYISHNADLFRQSKPEHVEQYFLRFGRFCDASSADFVSLFGVHDNIHHFDLSYLVKHLPGLISQVGSLAELTEGLPNDEREEADQDMGLDPVFFLVPDWTKLKVVFVNAKGHFCFGKLDICFPEIFCAPISDVAAQ